MEKAIWSKVEGWLEYRDKYQGVVRICCPEVESAEKIVRGLHFKHQLIKEE